MQHARTQGSKLSAKCVPAARHVSPSCQGTIDLLCIGKSRQQAGAQGRNLSAKCLQPDTSMYVIHMSLCPVRNIY